MEQQPSKIIGGYKMKLTINEYLKTAYDYAEKLEGDIIRFEQSEQSAVVTVMKKTGEFEMEFTKVVTITTDSNINRRRHDNYMMMYTADENGKRTRIKKSEW